MSNESQRDLKRFGFEKTSRPYARYTAYNDGLVSGSE